MKKKNYGVRTLAAEPPPTLSQYAFSWTNRPTLREYVHVNALLV